VIVAFLNRINSAFIKSQFNCFLGYNYDKVTDQTQQERWVCSLLLPWRLQRLRLTNVVIL